MVKFFSTSGHFAVYKMLIGKNSHIHFKTLSLLNLGLEVDIYFVWNSWARCRATYACIAEGTREKPEPTGTFWHSMSATWKDA